MPAKNVEESTIVLIFIPLICLVKCFCPRNRAAKEMQPVLRPMRHALTEEGWRMSPQAPYIIHTVT